MQNSKRGREKTNKTQYEKERVEKIKKYTERMRQRERKKKREREKEILRKCMKG